MKNQFAFQFLVVEMHRLAVDVCIHGSIHGVNHMTSEEIGVGRVKTAFVHTRTVVSPLKVGVVKACSTELLVCFVIGQSDSSEMTP